jgi:hypothetical protein
LCSQKDQGDGGTEGGALGNPDKPRFHQRIAKEHLEDRARCAKGQAKEGPGDDPGQTQGEEEASAQIVVQENPRRSEAGSGVAAYQEYEGGHR